MDAVGIAPTIGLDVRLRARVDEGGATDAGVDGTNRKGARVAKFAASRGALVVTVAEVGRGSRAVAGEDVPGRDGAVGARLGAGLGATEGA